MGGGTATAAPNATLEGDEELGDLASILEEGVERDELDEHRPEALAGMLESHEETYLEYNTLLVPKQAAEEVEEEYESFLGSAENKTVRSNTEILGAVAGFLGACYGAATGNYAVIIGSLSSGTGLLALSDIDKSESEDLYKQLNSYEAEVSQDITCYQLEK